MRVRAIALALAVAATMGSAACAPPGLNGSNPTHPSLEPDRPDQHAVGPAGSAIPAGSAVPDEPVAGDDAAAPPASAPFTDETPEAASTSIPDPNSTGLNFTARTVQGAAFAGASLLGKPTVLWFWAPGCPTCRAQVPDVLATDRQFSGKLNVVGVAGLDGAAAIRTFVADQKLGAVTNLFDTTGTVWKKFKITRQGMYVLLDATGKVRYTGVVARGELAKQIALLGL